VRRQRYQRDMREVARRARRGKQAPTWRRRRRHGPWARRHAGRLLEEDL